MSEPHVQESNQPNSKLFHFWDNFTKTSLIVGNSGLCNMSYLSRQISPATLDELCHHIAMVVDVEKNRVACYRNGVLFANSTASINPSEAAYRAPLIVHAPNYMLDELRLYDGLLSAENVQSLYAERD